MFDVDGTLLLSDRTLGGYEVLPGAIEVLTALGERGFPFVLLTNGSNYPPAEQAARLRNSGLPVADTQMITPSSVAADHLSRRGIGRVLVLGTRGVGHALEEAGMATLYTGEPGASEVDAVYVGWHPQCGMRDIETAAHAIWKAVFRLRCPILRDPTGTHDRLQLCHRGGHPSPDTRSGYGVGQAVAACAALRRQTAGHKNGACGSGWG